MDDGRVIEEEVRVANEHSLGERPLSRSEYINKFKVRNDGIFHSAERSRLIKLVQRLPDLTLEEIRLLKPAVCDTYLVENQLKGVSNAFYQ